MRRAAFFKIGFAVAHDAPEGIGTAATPRRKYLAHRHYRRAGVDRTVINTFRHAILIAVHHQKRRRDVIARRDDGAALEANQRRARRDPIADLHQRRKVLTVEINRIQPDMDQNLCAVIAYQTDRVMGQRCRC